MPETYKSTAPVVTVEKPALSTKVRHSLTLESTSMRQNEVIVNVKSRDKSSKIDRKKTKSFKTKKMSRFNFPNAPKKAVNAYMHFVETTRKGVMIVSYTSYLYRYSRILLMSH